MHSEYVDLAEHVKMYNIPLNVVSLMRENDVNAMTGFHVEHYPTIRLYKGNGGGFIEYPSDEDGNNNTQQKFLAWLKEQGVSEPAQKDPASLVGPIE